MAEHTATDVKLTAMEKGRVVFALAHYIQSLDRAAQKARREGKMGITAIYEQDVLDLEEIMRKLR